MAQFGATVSFYFELGDKKWKETYYWLSTTDTGDPAQDAFLLAPARAAFLSKVAQLSDCSLSEIQFDEDGFILPAILRDSPRRQGNFMTPMIGARPGVDDTKAWLMILYRCQNAVWGFKRSVMTRGSTSTDWGYDPARPFAPAYPGDLRTAATPWQDALRGYGANAPRTGSWCIKGVARDPAVNARFGVISVSAGNPPNNNWVVTLDDNDVRLAPGATVKIGGMRGPWSAGLNALQTIKTNDAGTLTLVGKKLNKCPVEYTGGGYAKRQLYQLFGIDTVDFVRFVVRDTGESERASRGRGRNNPLNSRYNG